MGTQKYVAYYRVSTDKQVRSGLGWGAEKAPLAAYVNGGQFLAEYVEVDSGKRGDRPELAKVLHRAKVTGIMLLIAKPDRLSRDAHFLLGLQKAGVRYVALDMPEANETMIGFMAIMAQHEREMISRRTGAELAAKARGVQLGNPNGARALRGRGNAEAVSAVKAVADSFAQDLRTVIEEVTPEGYASYRAIADELNNRDIKTAKGGRWHSAAVRNVAMRLGGCQERG